MVVARLQDVINQNQQTVGLGNTHTPKFWKPETVVNKRREEWETYTLASIRVPVKYRQYRMSDFMIRANPESCFDLESGSLDWSHNGFFLRGTYGQGKSCFAGALIRAMLHPDCPAGIVEQIDTRWVFKRDSVVWWHSSDLTNWILDMTFSGQRSRMFDELLRPKVVVLDDLGRERINNDAIREALGTAIERWTSNNRFLIVTTNIPDDNRLAEYEGFIASRLNDLVEVVLPPRDLRGAFK